MSQQRKKAKGGSAALSRQPSTSNAAEAEERARDEMTSLEAIFADDFKAIAVDDPGKPLHFQIRVRPLPNEPDARNHCAVLLDAMLSAAPLPLIVLRKGQGIADSVVEELQRAVDAEAARLVAKGEESIIYSIVCLLTELLQPHNVAPKSFHQIYVERAAHVERTEKEQAALHIEQQQAVRNEEKEALRMQIDAANRKKEDLLRAKVEAIRSPASVAASPSMLSGSPPTLPSFHLGASATAPSTATKGKSASVSAAATPARSAPQPVPASTKPSSHVHVGVSATGKGTKKGSEAAAHKVPVRRDASLKIKAKAQEKGKSRHKPRELREAASDSDESGDEQSRRRNDMSGSEDESDVSDSQSDASGFNSADEELLFASPSSSLTQSKGAGSGAGMSALDKLMREVELKDAAAEKARTKKAAAAARKKLLSVESDSEQSRSGGDHSDSQDDPSDDSEEEEDEDEDDESEGSDVDGPSRAPVGVAGSTWMERNTSGSSDAATAAAAANAASASLPMAMRTPALPYYSRFHSDFEVLEMLGKGGFGEVFKVRNKVDQLFYAVKRIRLTRKNPAMNQKIIKEVSFIAMLHHRYIVRYYQAWIEGEDPGKEDAASAGKGENGGKPRLARKSSTTTVNAALHASDDDEDWLSPSHPSTLDHNAEEDDEDASDEDDDSGSDEDDDEDSTSASPAAAGRQYLYIQMEYCPNKTLRDIIDERLFEQNPEDCWRLFRQLLEAVAFLHKKGLIHRDIKPPNVFISMNDSISQVKLGDFGLAVLSSTNSGANAGDGQADATGGGAIAASGGGAGAGGGGGGKPDGDMHNLSRQDSITDCVGTHFYSAPEQRARGVHYDHKVDMFSCGIIFFEMVYPFNSLMERALQLEELRTTGKVPNEFLIGRPDRLNIIKIIESLLTHRPEERPTAADLLKSGLIPLKVEDEYIELTLKSCAARDSVHHSRLLDILFAMPPEPTIDFTFDYACGSSRMDMPLHTPSSASSSQPSSAPSRVPSLHFHQLCQMRVFDTVSTIFRNHGAIVLSPPIITPKSNISSNKTNTALYLDPQGTVIKLPYTLTVPFARYVAQQSAWTWSGNHSDHPRGEDDPHSAGGAATPVASESESDLHFDLRRYEISKVYRKNIIGGRPKEMAEADFDIVWANAYANTAAAIGTAVAPASSSASASSTAKDARAAAREKLCCLSAEVLKLTYDVLQEFVPAIGTSFVIKVNHSDLFDAILDVVLAQPPPAAAAASNGSSKAAAATAAALQAQREDTALLRRQLCKLAGSYALFQGSWTKSPMRRQLLREKKLSPRKIDLLGSLFQIKSEPGKPEAVFARVRDTLFSSAEARSVLSEARVVEQLDFIRSLFGFLRLLHVDAHIVFDISICGKHDLYTGGLVFQALVPNTNVDLTVGGSGGGAGGGGDRGGSGATLPCDDSPAHFSGNFSNNSSFGSGRTESTTQNAFETIALGGQYDNLIASFMPPTASVPLSAVGVNFAIEKIVTAVALAHMKSSKPLNNPVLQRRMKKSLHGGDSGHILLYSSRNGMVKERVTLANDLWVDGLSCLYLHPPHLNYSHLKHYAKEHMLRWLIIFRRQEFKESGQVQVVDLLAGQASKGGGAREQDSAAWMAAGDVSSYVRARMAGKRDAELAASGALREGAAAQSSHSHSASHRKPDWHVHIIDSSSIKAGVKNQILTAVKRALNSALAGANPATFAVCAVDLPFVLIRALTSAVYQSSAHVHAVIEDSHAKQRALCEQLVAYMVKKSGGTLLQADAPLSSSKSKDKAAASAGHDTKEKVEMLYIFSVPDRKADMIIYS